MMQPIPGGALARPFVTHHNTLDMQLFLRIAPELYLKRLTVGGIERVYEINRNFRNEGISTQHNPEFTMLEFYQTYSDYQELMVMTEEMISSVARQSIGSDQIKFGEHEISLASPYRRVSLREGARQAAAERLGVPVTDADLRNRETAAALARKLRLELHPGWGAGRIATEIFERLNEDDLIQPTFVYDFPTEVSPLSKQKPDDPETVERFELYIGGFEVANAFSELNDPAEQRRRFEAQIAGRVAGDLEAHVMDEDYIRALEYGLPPTAGEGVGIDRLVMLLTNSASIRDVILFPLMRRSGKLAEFMDLPFELFIAVRYLFARRKQAFISLISLISAVGVAVGVMALLIVLALMTGLQGELRDRIVGSTAHIYVYKPGAGFGSAAEEVKKVRDVPRVVGAAPVVLGQGLATERRREPVHHDQRHRAGARAHGDQRRAGDDGRQSECADAGRRDDVGHRAWQGSRAETWRDPQ